MKNKLIYILNSYSSGSSEHYFHVINLLKEIATLNVKIILIIEHCEGERPEIEGVDVVVLGGKNIVARYMYLAIELMRLRSLGFEKVFIRIASKTAFLASLVYGIKVYYWQSGQTLPLDLKKPFGIKKIYWYINTYLPFRLISTTCYRFVTGPESMLKYYEGIGVKRDKLLCLYNDVDLKRFKPMKNDKVNNGNINILFVHRMSPVRKSDLYFPNIIKALNSTSLSIKLIMAGAGPERPILENMAKESEDNVEVTFLGAVANSEIQSLYNEADIFINPTYTEGFPRVLLEAMSCGLPIITTDAGGIRDILGKEQLKLMSSREDSLAFSENLVRLINDRQLQKKLNIENIDNVKRFNTPLIAKQYVDGIFK